MAAVLAVLNAVAAAFQKRHQGDTVVGRLGNAAVGLVGAVPTRAAAQHGVVLGYNGGGPARDQAAANDDAVRGCDKVLVEAGIA